MILLIQNVYNSNTSLSRIFRLESMNTPWTDWCIFSLCFLNWSGLVQNELRTRKISPLPVSNFGYLKLWIMKCDCNRCKSCVKLESPFAFLLCRDPNVNQETKVTKNMAGKQSCATLPNNNCGLCVRAFGIFTVITVPCLWMDEK